MKIRKKTLKQIFKLSSKFLTIFMVISLGLIGINFKLINSIKAGELGQELIVAGGVANGNKIEFYDNKILMGTVEAHIYDKLLTPVGNKYLLPTFSENYQVSFLVTIINNDYTVKDIFVNGLYEGLLAGDMTKGIFITSNKDLTVTFNFEKSTMPPPPGPDGPGAPDFTSYPILAYFEGMAEPVEMDPAGDILVPDSWLKGTISFKAKVCTEDGIIVPDDGISTCDAESASLMDLNIQGIANQTQINNTVSGGEDNKNIIVTEEFNNYGKVGIHLTNEIINNTVNIITTDLINVVANAPMNMSYSYGSSTIDQAILTTSLKGELAIFFGNNEVTLMALGPNVAGITNVSGAPALINDEDGSAKVTLPALSEETETPVVLTIKMLDGKTVTRELTIIRTALELSFDGENKTINAGYVMHKAYLYNNQSHDDNSFNAYLQVIIYRDNLVVGYKQVQIDDEEFVNNLGQNESGSIESFGAEPIVLYNGNIEGANRLSVFLTNGPIDFKSNTLPSVEFGIGAGVQIEWEN